LGASTFWKSIERLRNKALVGLWQHLEMYGQHVREWVEDKSFPVLKYQWKVDVLSNDWLCFHLLTVEDASRDFMDPWVKA